MSVDELPVICDGKSLWRQASLSASGRRSRAYPVSGLQRCCLWFWGSGLPEAGVLGVFCGVAASEGVSTVWSCLLAWTAWTSKGVEARDFLRSASRRRLRRSISASSSRGVGASQSWSGSVFDSLEASEVSLFDVSGYPAALREAIQYFMCRCEVPSAMRSSVAP